MYFEASSKLEEANLQYTMTIVEKIGDLLASHGTEKIAPQEPSLLLEGDWDSTLGDIPALQKLSNTFNLSPFEQSVLLICVGMEVSPGWSKLCHQTSIELPYPTFALAEQLFTNQDWTVYMPSAPIRYWELVKIALESPLIEASLRIDERILHYLLGYEYLEMNLDNITVPADTHAYLVESYQQPVKVILDLWRGVNPGTYFPVIQLYGKDPISQRMVAIAAANKLDYSVHILSEESLSLKEYDLCGITRSWEREFKLKKRLLIIHWENSLDESSRYYNAIRLLLKSSRFPIILISHEQQSLPSQKVVSFFIGTPSRQEQMSLWLSHGWDLITAEKVDYDQSIESVVNQFNLSIHSIESASTRAQSAISPPGTGNKSSEPSQRIAYEQVWSACRLQSRQGMEQLAERISSNVALDDLVLPEKQKETLNNMIEQVRYQYEVYHRWGFADHGSRGLSISAMFSGTSGTGKTMAAGVIAGALKLDLYRIDLSSITSKYIGETEKNLRKVFDTADSGGVVLLFDEADAVFGKRSEVKDSRDRYANLEVSYLLQRIESYQGLIILTTNLQDSIDPAFLRRIRFMVKFPFPSIKDRTKIWERSFPEKMPVENLDYGRLARLNVSGGEIRNIVLRAAFIAAGEGRPVSMSDLLQGTHLEYDKLGRNLPSSEIQGWVD